MRKIVYLVLLLAGFTTWVQAFAQAPVQLSPILQIRKGVDAWPLILNPKNDAERRINKHLSDLNAQLSHYLKECHANYVQQVGKQHRSAKKGEEGAEFWTQVIKVTMSGPAFLSLVPTTDYYCGGAHPYGYTKAAVFDLSTGDRADPVRWFQPSLKVSLAEEDEDDPAVEKSVSAVALLQAYREATHHQCDDTFSDDQPFLIWPDENSCKVVIQADRLPGCCEACGIETGLTLEQARRLGFSETFLQAISDAHRKLAHRQYLKRCIEE